MATDWNETISDDVVKTALLQELGKAYMRVVHKVADSYLDGEMNPYERADCTKAVLVKMTEQIPHMSVDIMDDFNLAYQDAIKAIPTAIKIEEAINELTEGLFKRKDDEG